MGNDAMNNRTAFTTALHDESISSTICVVVIADTNVTMTLSKYPFMLLVTALCQPEFHNVYYTTKRRMLWHRLPGLLDLYCRFGRSGVGFSQQFGELLVCRPAKWRV